MKAETTLEYLMNSGKLLVSPGQGLFYTTGNLRTGGYQKAVSERDSKIFLEYDFCGR